MAINLSVNINKVALIRNARGSNFPNILTFAKDCEQYGAQGITVHPRPDGRHIRFDDLHPLKEVVTTEFNIEGYPSEEFVDIVLDVRPHQVTLVPDAPDALTSDNGWDTKKHQTLLKEVVNRFHAAGIRTSLFINPIEEMLVGAKNTGTDRIEFYTGPYAHDFHHDKVKAIEEYKKAAMVCNELQLGINAGHDLNLDNLQYFAQEIPNLMEVSIGHALVVDALYYGIRNTIGMYRRQLVIG